jgi:two-component system, NtrC family, response regulator AtoC
MHILLVEDDSELRVVLCDLLRQAHHDVVGAEDGAVALDLIASKTFDLVVSDIRLPRVDGLSLFRAVKERLPLTEVVLMATHASVSEAVKAVKDGARDYLMKPFDVDELQIIVQRIANERQLRHELEEARVALALAPESRTMVGRSPQMAAALARLEAISQSHAAVLISGESGTGKELVARALHDRSSRRGKAFVVANCAAFPEGLIEGELFGYERGAFTGADTRRDGRFKAADGGTLFFDEVAELSLPSQAKLLRVLQESTFEPLGSNTSVSVDVRIVSATHRNLKTRVAEGLFREDLFYRLNVLSLTLPSLRDRQGDLPFLFHYFIKKFTPPGKEALKISPRAWASIAAYPFPGNIRELAHAVERAVVMASGEEIDWQHLPRAIVGRAEKTGGPAQLATLQEALGQFEKDYINHALTEAGGSKLEAAALLGISRKNLWEKMRTHGLGAATRELR